ncbi:MAG: hypothetical protein ABI666_01970 [Ferruginibacter sp.]
MKKTLLIITWNIMMLPDVQAQDKNGFENYNLLSSRDAYVWMPVVHHLGKNGLYTEMRYNYEDRNTASVYVGKNFSDEKTISYSVKPMLGIVFGKFNGGSIALNVDADYKKLYISMQTQYTISKDEVTENFFFNWTEIGYQPVKWFYTGLSTQLTKIYKRNPEAEYGILVAFSLKKITIPIYVFSPLSNNRNFIIGINTEW